MARTFIIREEIAAQVGMNAAIIHERLKYMLEQNYREGRNHFEGSVWVAATYEDWSEYVPLLSVKQIRTAFSRLIEAGLVKTDSFNKQKTDRKLWYTISDVTQYAGCADLPPRANPSAPEGKSTSAPEGKSTSAPEGRSYKDKNLKESKETIVQPTPAPTFSRFWEEWPLRKVNRKKAEVSFKRLSVSDKRAAIDQVQRWATSWRTQNPQATDLHATTYLNGKRWQDEFPASPSRQRNTSEIARWNKISEGRA